LLSKVKLPAPNVALAAERTIDSNSFRQQQGIVVRGIHTVLADSNLAFTDGIGPDPSVIVKFHLPGR
jgi:hypothetical protein